jgi:hypothetical protein
MTSKMELVTSRSVALSHPKAQRNSTTKGPFSEVSQSNTHALHTHERFASYCSRRASGAVCDGRRYCAQRTRGPSCQCGVAPEPSWRAALRGGSGPMDHRHIPCRCRLYAVQRGCARRAAAAHPGCARLRGSPHHGARANHIWTAQRGSASSYPRPALCSRACLTIGHATSIARYDGPVD